LESTEVAEILRVPVGTLYSWRRRGLGPRAISVGKYLRYDPRDLQVWLDEKKQAS
jgi:DNA-binding transcriptional MerR regulator